MPTIGQSQRFVGKVSATLELRCLEHGCANITELLGIAPTEASPLEVAGSPDHPLAWMNGCYWCYDSASRINSTKVSDHIRHLSSMFLPIKSQIEELRPIPQIKISVYWECSNLGVSGLTGPQFSPNDLKALAELGASLEVKVIAIGQNEIPQD